MAEVAKLPLPRLEKCQVNSLVFMTDDALASSVGISMGFTTRLGGVSQVPYDQLNLGDHVNDDPCAVRENRRRLLAAAGAPDACLLIANQVHGDTLVKVDSRDDQALRRAKDEAAAGADGFVVTASQVMAVINTADCLPVIMVSPTGHFASVHAGWRGAYAGITGKALRALCEADGIDAMQVNLYIGPFIHGECFEVGADVAALFEERYGSACLLDSRHVDLGAAVRIDAQRAGASLERVADAQICTVCSSKEVFSYRASGGVCGRQGAFCVRR